MQIDHLGVFIDTSRDSLLSEFSLTLLRDYYCRKDEDTPQKSFARASVAFSGGDMALAQRIYNAVSKGWFMFASPVLSNAALPGEKVKSLPISCFLTYVPDSLKGLIDHTAELRWLSVKGGGVGGHWSSVRSVSNVAPGPIPFLHTVDSDMTAYRQGTTRKGSYAAYLDVSHPDIMEFLTIRVPTGDVNRKCMNLHHAVNVTNDFMRAVENDSDWHLRDPNDGTIRETMRARKLWETILEVRYRTGEPYINFIDTANEALPQALKDRGLKIHGSNLCNEIHLPTSEERTAVCCLSSLNLEKYDEWKNTGLVKDLVTMLDNVLQVFIENAGDEISRARFSAQRERSLGLGAMGLHSYYQQRGIPFASEIARQINKEIFSDIFAKAREQSRILGRERGEAPDMEGTGMRNAHVIAIAPNANSSIIHGCSPSIEPWKANAFTHRTRAGSHLVKNEYLKQLLTVIGKDTDEVWSSIITNGGSVQHLDFLSEHQKQIFATAIEIDQMEIVTQAAWRQKWICQGQSLNLFFPAGASRGLLHHVHFAAWKLGCKGLYYLRTESSNRAENVSKKVERNKLVDISEIQVKEETQEECVACQG
jgi:ribonucleoside-diphosphate reductase alpha chain